MTGCILLLSLLDISLAFAEENIEYRFERLWPQIEQPWYFDFPTDVAIAPDGNVYVTDTRNYRVQQFTSQGDFIRAWGSKGAGNGQFNDLRNIAIASDGSVYVADLGNHRMQQFTS